MIGGVVLDATVLSDLAEQRTPYANQVVDTALTHLRVICVPAAALMECWSTAKETAQAFLAMFAGLPVVVVDALDESAAVDAGALAAAAGFPDAPAGTVHAVHVARTRSWPLLTVEPVLARRLDPNITIEPLP